MRMGQTEAGVDLENERDPHLGWVTLMVMRYYSGPVRCHSVRRKLFD